MKCIRIRISPQERINLQVKKVLRLKIGYSCRSSLKQNCWCRKSRYWNWPWGILEMGVINDVESVVVHPVPFFRIKSSWNNGQFELLGRNFSVLVTTKAEYCFWRAIYFWDYVRFLIIFCSNVSAFICSIYYFFLNYLYYVLNGMYYPEISMKNWVACHI